MTNMENEKKQLGAGEVCQLAHGTIIDGNIEVPANVRLEGTINGNIKCSGRLVMSKAAEINGDVDANELVSEGKVKGDVNVKKITVLQPTAVIVGDLKCESLQIENGAIFNGSCTMHKK